MTSQPKDVKITTIENPSKFITFCQKVIPLAFDESMSYYECLCAIKNYIEKTVVPAVNGNADATAELAQLFNQLNDYVTNYFDNLDVQDEINNKLDAMVEAGTLQEIIGDYLNATAIWGFDTVADMKSATNLIDGSYAKTLGYHSKNDGGMATYKIREITNSDVVNEMDIIAIGNGNLIAELILNDEINVKQLGAYGNNNDDDTDFIKRALELDKTIVFPKGRYILKDNITVNNVIIRGSGQFNTRIKITNDVSGFAITMNSDHAKITDLTVESPDYDYEVKGTTNSNTCFRINNKHHITFQNVRCVGFNRGFQCEYAWCLTFIDCMTICCNYGIYASSEFNNVLFSRCIFNTCDYGLTIRGGYSICINASDIENNNVGIDVTSNTEISCRSCYFENNTTTSIDIRWGNTYVRSFVLDECSFWANSNVNSIMKYHSAATAYIVYRNCVFRNNGTLSPGTTPILVKNDNGTLVFPHFVGCIIGDSFSLINDCYIDHMMPIKLEVSDWIDLADDCTINDFAVYENNKHVYGNFTVTKTTAFASASTSIGSVKTKYLPKTNVNTFATQTSYRYSQDTSNLCYFYISSTSVDVKDGDGVSTIIKVNLDYVTK